MRTFLTRMINISRMSKVTTNFFQKYFIECTIQQSQNNIRFTSCRSHTWYDAADSEFNSPSGQTIGVYCLSTEHAAWRSKYTDLLARNQHSMTDWSHISDHALQFRELVLYILTTSVGLIQRGLHMRTFLTRMINISRMSKVTTNFFQKYFIECTIQQSQNNIRFTSCRTSQCYLSIN
jgi:hypothetical protein